MTTDTSPIPVVCLHSSAASGRQWAALEPQLGGRYRVLAPDLAGYGGNDPWPANRELSLAGEAARLKPIIEAQDRPVHLVGHSYGAAVAVRLALDLPRRVRSLALYEPTLFSVVAARAARPCGIEEVAAVADQVREYLGRGENGEAARAFVVYWAGLTAWDSLSPEQRDRLARRVHKAPSDFAALFQADIGPRDLRQLDVPVLCLCGAVTRLPARRVAESFRESIPAIEAVRIPGLGHMGPMTHPTLINELIRRFVTRHDHRAEDISDTAAALARAEYGTVAHVSAARTA